MTHTHTHTHSENTCHTQTDLIQNVREEPLYRTQV